MSDILQEIGKTALVRLNKIYDGNTNIYVKLESKNPGSSIKDRIAYYMLDKALKSGAISMNTTPTIIEPTSGNTGIALAMVAALYKMHCIVVMPENMSIERQKLIAAYGAKLVLTPAKLGIAGAVQEAKKLLSSIDNAFMPNQFDNVHAVEAHYYHTAPEIFNDMNGKELDAFVSVFGTGSAISGCGLYLKEKYPQTKIVAVEPTESPLLSQGKSAAHGIQGIGTNFIPSILRTDIIDKIITISTDEAIETARSIFKLEGISCGISSGANVLAAIKLA